MINVLLSTQTVLYLAGEAAESITTTAFLFTLVIVAILIVFNGFFVAAEFAILGSRAARMERLGDEGNKTARNVLGILENNDRQNAYLATAQLGITVVTLALAQYGEPRIAKYLESHVIGPLVGEIDQAVLHTIGYVISLGLLTYLHVVIGEMVPKSLALAQPNKMALRLFRPMSLLQKLLAIPIRILNGIGDLLLKLFRIPPEHGTARLYSSEEIEQLVSESTEGGLITEGAHEIVGNIFDFHDREVGQVMTPRKKLQGVPVDITYDELIKLVVSSRHSRFPVFEEDLDHIVGILHLKDLLKHYRNGRENFVLRKLLRPTPVVPEDHSVTELLRAFKLQRIHMAIVIDEYGGVAGIVTLEDLVEEIVGEVRDEFDLEREPLVEIAPGTLEMSGDYLLDDLKDIVFLGEEETLPAVDTVGGLVVTHIGGPPALNDEILLNNEVTLRVTGVEGRAVTRLRVDYPTPEDMDNNGVLDSAENNDKKEHEDK